MDPLRRDDLRELAESHQPMSVSLYMPTNRVESELAQNPIRFKNLLRAARQQLSAVGHRQSEVDAVLAPAYELLDAKSFWHTMNDGLAAFLQRGKAHFFRLPLSFAELAATGHRFHLKQLFPLFATNNRFFILALSKNRVLLYQGTHYSVQQIESSDIPRNIVEALPFEDPERQLQFHTGARTTDGRQDAVRHGQGTSEEDARSQPKDALYRFFRQVNKGVRDVLRDEVAPLVLAGVEYYLPIYRAVNDYPHLIEDQLVSGNADYLTAKELHKRAWDVVEPIFQLTEKEAIEQYKQLRHLNDRRSSESLKEVVPAAVFSRVDTLFVPIGVRAWGQYDPTDNSVQIHDNGRQPGDEDLLDLAAVHTYLNGGTVHVLRPENMPVSAPVAATFRFPSNVSAAESDGR
jgi:hypothetical protein